MDWGMGWTIVGILLAAVTGYFSIRAYFRDHPKRRLEYTVMVQRLIANPAAAQHLEVRARGVLIANPHLVEVTLRSNSRANIPSSEFDQGRPLTITLRAPSVMIRPSNFGQGFQITGFRTDWKTFTEVDVGPALIHPNASVGFAVITAGQASCHFPDSLVSVPIRKKREPQALQRLDRLGDLAFRYVVMPIVIIILWNTLWGLVGLVAQWFTGSN